MRTRLSPRSLKLESVITRVTIKPPRKRMKVLMTMMKRLAKLSSLKEISLIQLSYIISVKFKREKNSRSTGKKLRLKSKKLTPNLS